jgi:uncharacterized membrane protein
MDWVPAIARWLHFMAGVMWIGLLYYFNFVQAAALKAATADGTAAGITKHVAPRALLFFRWSAVVTWLAGAALLGNQFVNAFTLSKGMAGSSGPTSKKFSDSSPRPTRKRSRHAGSRF